VGLIRYTDAWRINSLNSPLVLNKTANLSNWAIGDLLVWKMFLVHLRQIAVESDLVKVRARE